MDKFVATHVSVDGAAHGPVTMGYYTRADLPFYYALADAFTVCDALLQLGARPDRLEPADERCRPRIDPAGTAGGPVVETFGNRIAEYGKLSWETMPERLQAAGVSWKVYNDRLSELALSPLPYFKAYTDPFSVTGAELVGRGADPGLTRTISPPTSRGTSCPRCRGSCRRWRSASTPPRRPGTART